MARHEETDEVGFELRFSHAERTRADEDWLAENMECKLLRLCAVMQVQIVEVLRHRPLFERPLFTDSILGARS